MARAALERYLRLMRVLYLTRLENLEGAGYSTGIAARFAGSTVFACTSMHLAIPALLAIAATGGAKGLSYDGLALAMIAALGTVLWWEVRYVEKSPSLDAIWTEMQAEPERARSRRKRLVYLVMYGTYATLLLSFGVLVLSVLPG
jgi:hypothetical protein